MRKVLSAFCVFHLVCTVMAQMPKTYKSLSEALQHPELVKILDLRGQGLQSLPEQFPSFTNLEKLDLTNNELSDFPAAISACKKLKILFVSNNKLRSLGNINEMLTLVNVKVDNNPFTQPNVELKKLTSLSNLVICSFSANKASVFPNEMLSLIKLTELDLSYNAIRSLPEGMDKMTGLKKINFARNFLTVFPKSFARLKKLENLDISYNEFKVLQSELSGLSSLQVLDCSFNKLLSNIPPFAALTFINMRSTKLNLKVLQSAKIIPISCSVIM